MAYYPILVDLEGQRVVVVGGGAVAQRKIETLLNSGAEVHVISRELTPLLQNYVKEGKISFLNRNFSKRDLNGAFLAIAATDDVSLNSQVGRSAKELGILVNVVDQPSDCNFIVPSILRRGDLIISISTSGKSPALAKRVREGLNERFGNEYEGFLRLMGKVRKEVLDRGYSQKENRKIFNDLVDSPILEALARDDWQEVAASLSGILGVKVTSDEVIDYLKAE